MDRKLATQQRIVYTHGAFKCLSSRVTSPFQTSMARPWLVDPWCESLAAHVAAGRLDKIMATKKRHSPEQPEQVCAS